MDKVVGRLTVFFEQPFWVGVFECISEGKLSVCKVTFGAEPKDYEVYDFVLKNYYRLRFSPAVETDVKETGRNPKRIQREVRKQVQNTGMDNTMKSVEKIAMGNGFDSFIMFNVYAQRATDPNQMNKEINPMLHKENMQAFQWILENSGKKPIIWAAWGTNIERRKYLKECLREMINISNRYNAVWCKVGKCSVKQKKSKQSQHI